MMTRSFIISSSLITVNQWFEHSQNTAVWECGESQAERLEAEGGSSLGVGEGMAERGAEQSSLPHCCPANWVGICCAGSLHELLGSGAKDPLAAWKRHLLSCDLLAGLCPAPGCALGAAQDGDAGSAGLLPQRAALGREQLFHRTGPRGLLLATGSGRSVRCVTVQ